MKKCRSLFGAVSSVMCQGSGRDGPGVVAVMGGRCLPESFSGIFSAAVRCSPWYWPLLVCISWKRRGVALEAGALVREGSRSRSSGGKGDSWARRQKSVGGQMKS